MLNPIPVHDDVSASETMIEQPHFVDGSAIKKVLPCEQKLQAIDSSNFTPLNHHIPSDNVIEDELELDQDEQQGLKFSIAKFALTSLASLIATCGIGLIIGKTDASIDTADNNLPRSNAVAEAKKHYSGSVNLPKPTPSKPEVIISPQRSATARETEQLVKEALAEYYTSLGQNMNAKSSQ